MVDSLTDGIGRGSISIGLRANAFRVSNKQAVRIMVFFILEPYMENWLSKKLQINLTNSVIYIADE
jgi:hypothetical protein